MIASSTATCIRACSILRKVGMKNEAKGDFVGAVTVRISFTRLDRVIIQMNVIEQKTETFHRHEV
jgi:hypothetical protein